MPTQQKRPGAARSFFSILFPSFRETIFASFLASYFLIKEIELVTGDNVLEGIPSSSLPGLIYKTTLTCCYAFHPDAALLSQVLITAKIPCTYTYYKGQFC